MTKYSSLLGIVPHVVAESPGTYHTITERHIQALWLEQKYFKNLETSSGQAVKVISPGIWNADAGPDFLKAHIEIDGTTIKGDIEIHLTDSSWIQHQHHTDPRYNNVVLHISLWNPARDVTLQTASNHHFHKIHLEKHLTVSPNRLQGLIDLDLYPYRKFVGSGKCSKQLFKALPIDKTIDLFTDAANWRLRQKLDYLQQQTSNPRLWCGAGIAMALGYKRNALSFLQMYLWLLDQSIYDDKTLFALCLKACGFFSGAYRERWLLSPYYAELLDLSTTLPATPSYTLEIHKIRPYNHPVRRLAYLAKMVADISHYTLSERLVSAWESSWQQPNPHKVLLDLIPTYTDDFFDHHYTFSNSTHSEVLSLLGPQLRQTILINVVLPILSSKITRKNNVDEYNALHALYASLPAENSSKTKYLTHRFFGNTPKGEILSRALQEQGAYQIHRDFCTHYEASCDGCPFVQRYQEQYQ